MSEAGDLVGLIAQPVGHPRMAAALAAFGVSAEDLEAWLDDHPDDEEGQAAHRPSPTRAVVVFFHRDAGGLWCLDKIDCYDEIMGKPRVTGLPLGLDFGEPREVVLERLGPPQERAFVGAERWAVPGTYADVVVHYDRDGRVRHVSFVLAA
jgi:hypothetical protein